MDSIPSDRASDGRVDGARDAYREWARDRGLYAIADQVEEGVEEDVAECFRLAFQKWAEESTLDSDGGKRSERAHDQAIDDGCPTTFAKDLAAARDDVKIDENAL